MVGEVCVGCLGGEMCVGGLMLDFGGGWIGDGGELVVGVGKDLVWFLFLVFGVLKMLFFWKKWFIVIVS